MRVLLGSIAVVACLSVGAAAPQAANAARSQADAFQRKLEAIQQHAEAPTSPSRRTTVTEGEINAWLVHYAPPLLPAGVRDPKVAARGGRLFGTVTVDLQDVGRQRSTGATLDPWRYLGGQVPIALSGVLHTENGRGQFTLQRAEILGVPMPRALLQEVVSYYTRTEDHPNGVRLDEPFELPAAIKQIHVGQGQAVVVQ